MFREDEFGSVPYLFIGIGLGIVAGLLMAPRSGEEIRQDVRRRANEGLNYLNQQVSKVRDGTGKAVAKGKQWIAQQREAALESHEPRRPYHEGI